MPGQELSDASFTAKPIQAEKRLLERAQSSGKYGLALGIIVGVASAAWYPIYGTPPNGLQISHAGILLSFVFLVMTVRKKGEVYLPKSMVAFCVCFIVFFFSSRVHSPATDLSLSSFKMFVYLLCAVAVANFNLKAMHDLRSVSLTSSVILFLVVYQSAVVAAVPFVESMVGFFSTLDFTYILYGILRPSFNAFNASDEILFSGSIMNEFGCGVVLIFIISVCDWLETGRRVSLAISSSTLFVTMISFSASAGLVLVVALPLVFVIYARSEKSGLGWFLFIIVFSAIFVGLYAITGYLYLLAEADADSASTRLDQYHAALTQFSENWAFGRSLFETDGHLIHNFGLSLAVTFGITGAILALVAHSFLFSDIIRMCGRATRRSPSAPSYMAGAACITIFAAVVMFGGGNGMPTSVSGVGLGVGYLFLRRARYIDGASVNSRLVNGQA